MEQEDKQNYEEYQKSYERIYNYESLDPNLNSPGKKLHEDGVQLKERMRRDGYTEEGISIVTDISMEELGAATQVIVDKATKDGVKKSEKPSFYHVAGQPGCGKSAAIKAIEQSSSGKPFASEMDVYRTMHPRIAKIKEMIAKKYPNDREKQGKEFVAFTAYFADMLELTVISHMISQGYSVIKETTGKNSKNICGMIDALKQEYPQMSASMACMAVSQEVSIDGTITRGDVMNKLTDLFVQDLQRDGINTKPVGRGNVPREFSESTCRKIPGSMGEIARSGLIDGEFLIVKRGDENTVVARIQGEDCVIQSEKIENTLNDRILGETARKEEEAHFAKKRAKRQAAQEVLNMGKVDKMVEIYVYPTKTWLKETDGALAYYQRKSGLIDAEDVARWVIRNVMLQNLEVQKEAEMTNETTAFDEEKRKADEALNKVGSKLAITSSQPTVGTVGNNSGVIR